MTMRKMRAAARWRVTPVDTDPEPTGRGRFLLSYNAAILPHRNTSSPRSSRAAV